MKSLRDFERISNTILISSNKMCWDAKTSIITLLIGSVLNIWNVLHYKDATITAISLFWEWVLFVQFFEAFAWNNQPSGGECNPMNKWAAKGVYLVTVSQPILFALVMLALKSDSISREVKIAATAATFLYVLWALYATNSVPEVTCLKPEDDCGNLTYTWWRQFPGGASIYLIVIAFLMVTLMKPFKFAMMQMVYLVVTLVGSTYFYSCGIGSVWCWFAAFAPILVGPMWEASKS